MNSDYVKQLEETVDSLKTKLEASILENEMNRRSLETLKNELHVLKRDKHTLITELKHKEMEIASLNDAIKNSMRKF